MSALATLKAEAEQRRADKLGQLARALDTATADLVIGPSGSVAIRGWSGGRYLSDLCAYRLLSQKHGAILQRAVARAEARSGRRVDRAWGRG